MLQTASTSLPTRVQGKAYRSSPLLGRQWAPQSSGMRAPPLALIDEAFFPPIRRLTGLSRLGLVGHGMNNAEWAQDSTGTLWVQKTEAEVETTAEMLAEVLGFQLGSAIGAPVPEIAVCLDAGGRASLSRAVATPTHWDAVHAHNLINYDELGAMITLDVLILNSDRHPGNLLLQPDPDDLHIRAWAIDAGSASAGYPGQFAAEHSRGQIPSLSNYVNDLPLRLAREGAVQAAEAAEGLSETTLQAFARECCSLAGNSEADKLADTLISRCRSAPQLLSTFWARLEKAQ